MRLLGVDTGGTFTDFVCLDGGTLRVHKVLSTPERPEQAIVRGIREMGWDNAPLRIVHGSTVATNALLEGKGVRTLYIANRGFADLLTIGRQARRELYRLQPEPQSPPVPAELCVETGGRLSSTGETLEPLTQSDLDALRAAVAALEPEAIAINLLFSFLDDGFERQIEALFSDRCFVSRSSRVLPEYREYERGVATWLNAYVGPLMKRYLGRLLGALQGSQVDVMQSHGGSISADQAGDHAVQLLLSGPAGGLVGAQYQARASGRERLMTFDMGGTSTDVALIDGEIGLTSESEIAGYPVAAPMVDMHTIGAGGGSIAWLDDGGMLQVGPQSAGADPGPACYGKGGDRPTVTDAHVVLGHLPPSTLLGGSMALDRHAAKAAVSALAARAGLETTAMARGILRIADEHMAQALRVISVQRGHDPREFTLVSFGGAGGLHICSLAEQLNMIKALVPAHGGVLSALGMVVARPARELSHAVPGLLENATVDELDARFTAFEAQLAREMNLPAPRFTRRLDCRYQGQSSVLSLAWRPDLDALGRAFHQQHRSQFGHALNNPIELVNLRLRATTADSPPDPPPWPNRKPARPESHADTDAAQQVPVYARSALAVGQTLAGPAIISESIATTWLAPGWQARMDEAGNLMLTRI